MQSPVPYKGTDPYIFVSYSHRDGEAVQKIIARMQRDGYRIWFDLGIDPGTEWDQYIAQKVVDCGYMIAFVSNNYIASSNCKDELNFARDLEKDRLIVYLEDVTLPVGMAMRMNRLQSVFRYKYNAEEPFYHTLYSANNLDRFRDAPPEKKPSPAAAAPEPPVKKAEPVNAPALQKTPPAQSPAEAAPAPEKKQSISQQPPAAPPIAPSAAAQKKQEPAPPPQAAPAQYPREPMRAEPPLRQPEPNPAAARTPAQPAPPIPQQPNMYTPGPAAVPAAPFITPPKKKKNSWKALYLYEKVLIICIPLIFLGVLLNVNNDPTYHLDWVVNALPIIPFIVSFIKKEELRKSPVIGIVFMVILGIFLIGLTFDLFDRIDFVNNVKTYAEWEWHNHLLVEDIIFLVTAVPLMARMIVDRIREAKHKAKNKAQNSVNMYR